MHACIQIQIYLHQCNTGLPLQSNDNLLTLAIKLRYCGLLYVHWQQCVVFQFLRLRLSLHQYYLTSKTHIHPIY